MNLATLAETKEWLRSNSQTFSDADDVLLGRLISRCSAIILGYIERGELTKHTVSEVRNGTGSAGMLLREWPVLSVTSITVGGISIPESASQVDNGFTYQAWDERLPGIMTSLIVRGYEYPRGLANTLIEYVAGYCIEDEAHDIVAGAATVDATLGPWVQDEGVTKDGVAMTKITTGTPTTGQYKLGTTPGSYVFATADNDDEVLISYSFIPQPLNQACVEFVAERFAYRTRVGQSSRSQGGQETVSFDLKAMQDFVKMALQPYKRVIPC